MSLPELPQAFGPVKALHEAWSDIVESTKKPYGFKREVKEREASEAFLRAVAFLGGFFSEPQAMTELLRDPDLVLPEGIDRGVLLHFAGRWRTHVETAQRIAQQDTEARGAVGMVILLGNRNPQHLTPDEAARRREEKKRNKKKKT